MNASPHESGVPAGNWNPAWLSTTIAVIVAVTGTLGLAVASGDIRPALLGVVAGVLLAATVVTIGATTRRVAIITGGVLGAVGGLTFLGAFAAAVIIQVPWPPVPPLEALAIAPFLTAIAGVATGFGAVDAIRDLSPETEGLRTTLRLPLIAVIPAVAVVLDQRWDSIMAGLDVLREVDRHVLAPSIPIAPDIVTALPRVAEVVVLVVLAGIVLKAALKRVPIVELASEASQPRAEAVRDGVRRLLNVMMLTVGMAVSALLFVIAASDSIPHIDLPPAVSEAIIVTAYSPLLRRLLVVALTIGAASIVATWLIRRLSSEQLRPSYLPVAPLLVGTFLTLAVFALHEPLTTAGIERAESDVGRTFLLDMIAQVGAFSLVSGVVLLGLATALIITITLSFGRLARFVASNSGPQLIASGVFLAAVAAGIGGTSIYVVFVGVATSLFVRDLSEFGATLGHEVGRDGASTHAEIVHGFGGVLFASIAVGMGVLTVVAVNSLPQILTPTTAVAVVTASIGTVLLFLTTR